MRNITELNGGEIFVFGSNKLGNHAGGAARIALEKFGAIMGTANGLCGKSYAIPTLDENMQKVPLLEIQESLRELVEVAKSKPDNTFLLTPIGTGIAGYTLDDLESILPELPENIIPIWK